MIEEFKSSLPPLCLKEEGMAKQTDSGWELTEDRKKAKSFINTQPSSAVNNPQTNAAPKYSNNPSGMPINKSIDSPLKDIYNGNDTTIKV